MRQRYAEESPRGRAADVDRYGRTMGSAAGDKASLDYYSQQSANMQSSAGADYGRSSSRYPREEVYEPLKTKEEYLRLAEMASR